ncbi:MAG: hypothetical protein DRP85_03165 [Candidatus Makaraimicrobium thalassicum]|nr:MAG: hypothetical protein DRP85_03165 [Candidatus Omnitrophota bacterium]
MVAHRTFVTFGQDHTHEIDGVIFDKDCIAVITGDSYKENRDTAFRIFGPKFCFEYPEDRFDDEDMHYYPRGYIPVN